MASIGTILLFLAVLSVLVIVHEIGHFVTALKLGCKVEEFGIGFPPKMFGWKRNGIEYTINWIPLGGFVRIKGESGDHKDDRDSFASKAAWKRFVILFAGVTMNFLLAVVLLSVGFMIGLPSAVDENVPAGARLADQAVRIVTVLEDSPADEAGILMGDKVLAINNQVVAEADSAHDLVKTQGEQEILLLIEREGGKLEYAITPTYLEELEDSGIGVGFMTTAFVSYPVHLAIWKGLETTVYFTKEITVVLYEIIKNLIFGRGLVMDISGPVGIAVMTGEVARLGMSYLIQFTAILSINLAIINAVPFPALDGGRILFLFIERLRGKPISERVETLVHNVGFLFLIGLIVLITFRDFFRFSDEIFGTVGSWFGV